MKYNFDEIIKRDNTRSVKYDLRIPLFGEQNVIPMWVADMDFATPSFILDDVKEQLSSAVMGYPIRDSGFENALKSWLEKRHSISIHHSWVKFSPGIVSALVVLIEAFTKKGDGILIQPPVYHPFIEVPLKHERRLIQNPLKLENDKYCIDFEDFENKLTESSMFILCNPHNPVGRSWTRDEMQKMAELCAKHDVLLVSDEIHSDLIFVPFKHESVLSLPKIQNLRQVTCFSPSKTFNLAGFFTSAVVIADPKMRQNYSETIQKWHMNSGNIFSQTSFVSAYEKGEEWLNQLLSYLSVNLDFTRDYLKQNIPNIKLIEPQATYLLWLDFRNLGMDDKTLRDFIIRKAGLGLSDGFTFGDGGSGFMRMNIACPKSVVETALKQLSEAIKAIREND